MSFNLSSLIRSIGLVAVLCIIIGCGADESDDQSTEQDSVSVDNQESDPVEKTTAATAKKTATDDSVDGENNDPGVPVIKPDDSHNNVGGGTDTYSVAAGAAIVVDSGSYTFKPSSLPNSALNAIHVMGGSNEYYRTAWDGKEKITLNAETLTAIKGDKFSGFKSGETYMVAVGHDDISESEKSMKFAPVWVGMVTVGGTDSETTQPE